MSADKPEDGEGNADDSDQHTEAVAQHHIRPDERVEAGVLGPLSSGGIHGRQCCGIGHTDILRAKVAAALVMRQINRNSSSQAK